MNTILLVLHLIAAISCAIFGILFRLGKGASIITGYSTASEAKKKTIDKIKFLINCSNLIFIVSISFVVLAVSDITENTMVLIIGLAILICAGIVSLIYIYRTFSKR